MANEIDELMDKDPLSLSEQDLDAIIAYHRQRRVDFEAGVKVKKPKGDKPSVSIDLEALGLLAAKPALKRRV